MLKERVILRAVEKKDIDFILLCENDTSVWSEGANTRFYSRYAIENYVESVQNTDIFSSCQSRMMIDITSPNGVKTVGCADLYDIDARHSRAGVGIYIE